MGASIDSTFRRLDSPTMFRRAVTVSLNVTAAAFAWGVTRKTSQAALCTQASSSVPISPLPNSFVNSSVARDVDEMLMTTPGFSIDQLMELAGLSVANAAHDFAQTMDSCVLPGGGTRVLIVAGPGNNGGDGLVAARHLHHFGYKPTIVYPKMGKTALFTNLVKQCRDLGIKVIEDGDITSESIASNQFIIDAMFGFSFKGEVREPFKTLLEQVKSSGLPTISVDIPSGWDVDKGDIHSTGFQPAGVISLTTPKQCMTGYEGKHYVGGRFVPPAVQARFTLDLPDYGSGTSQVARYQDKETDTSAAMTDSNDVNVVYVTASSEEEAKRIARGLLEEKLAACVNIVPKVTSIYEWEGKMEEDTEVLMMIKSPVSLLPKLTETVQKLHSYDVPEVIAVPVQGGSRAYIQWVQDMSRKA